MAGTPSRTQHAFRFRSDAGTVDVAATWIANENTNVSWNTATNFRLRIMVRNVGTATTGNQTWAIQYQKNGAGGYQAITTTSSNIRAADAGSSVDNAALATQRLTTPASGTFVSGQYDETGTTGNVAITTGNYTELEYGLVIVDADVAYNDYFDFRLLAAGAALQSYLVTPRLKINVTFNVPTGSYTLTGSAAAKKLGRVTTAGSYTLTGSAAAKKLGRVTTAGSYTLTGSAASLCTGYKLLTNAGSYTLTGSISDANLGRVTTAGAYTLTGSPATLRVDHKLLTNAGSYAVTGYPADIDENHALNTVPGTYAVTGNAASLTLTLTGTHALNTAPGSYAKTGAAARLARHWVMSASTGTYDVTGSPADLLATLKSRRKGSTNHGWMNQQAENAILAQDDDDILNFVIAFVTSGGLMGMDSNGEG